MKLAIIVRASFASRRERNGMKWGTLLVHTGGIDGMWVPKVQYQVLGAHVKVVL